MARRYRRNAKFRTKRKNLKTVNILTKKSATSQAKQILDLRKSISQVRRLLPKQNRLVFAGVAQTSTFSSSDFTNVGFVHKFEMPVLFEGGTDGPIEGDNTDYRTGNWIKVISAYYSIQIRYNFTSGANGQYDGNYSGAQIRFVLLASRRASQFTPTLNGTFQQVGTTGTNYDNNITVPLREGINSEYIVLGQRKYTLSTTNRVKSIRLHFPMKRLRNYITWDVQNPTYNPKHQLYLVAITSGLNYQGIISAAANGISVVYKPWLIFVNT